MMTSVQVVETSANVTTNVNSPSQDYTHPDDRSLPTSDITPGFKPFTVQKMYNAVVQSFCPHNTFLLSVGLVVVTIAVVLSPYYTRW